MRYPSNYVSCKYCNGWYKHAPAKKGCSRCIEEGKVPGMARCRKCGTNYHDPLFDTCFSCSREVST